MTLLKLVLGKRNIWGFAQQGWDAHDDPAWSTPRAQRAGGRGLGGAPGPGATVPRRDDGVKRVRKARLLRSRQKQPVVPKSRPHGPWPLVLPPMSIPSSSKARDPLT